MKTHMMSAAAMVAVIACASALQMSTRLGDAPADVQLAVSARGVFRISLRVNGSGPMSANDSPMIADQSKLPPANNVTMNGYVGINSTFGGIYFNPVSGAFMLLDASGKNITSSPELFDFAPAAVQQKQHVGAKREYEKRSTEKITEITPEASCDDNITGRTDCHVDGQGPCEAAGCCWSPVNPNPNNYPWCFKKTGPPPPPTPPPPPGKCTIYNGVDVNGGNCIDTSNVASSAACCSKCTANSNCQLYVYATPGHESGGMNCWQLTGVTSVHYASDRDVGYVRGPEPVFPPPPPPQTTATLVSSPDAKFYGAGAGSGSASTLSMKQSSPHVANTEFMTSHYWSSDGYASFVVTDIPNAPNDITSYPANWAAQSSSVEWTVLGNQVDMYFMMGDQPTALSYLWDLIGRPAIPPRYAFGFLACRWGWKDRDYIYDMLSQFRSGNFPIDAWISDFGWFTSTPDYTLPPQGIPNYTDFGYNPTTFPAPVPQLDQYHNELNMKFGGIRKPRLGNSDLLIYAHSQGWTINPSSATTGVTDGGIRNLNYSIAACRQWYAQKQAQYLKDGVDFWWNDEGETFYFAFHWWNVAQQLGLTTYNPKKRFWTINRSYSPGMSRLGAVLWTGDIQVSWQALSQQPGYVLNWHMAGVGFVTCDSGGFSGGDDTPLLLTRWYQYACFMPVMRVHSTLADTPHFPFLYGPEAGDAMREALNLRYQLVPYHYSLAHNAYRTNDIGDGVSMMRPLLWSYPDDDNVAEMTTQWFDGPDVMVAPVLNDQNTSSVYLPAGTWYEWNSSTTHTGPTTLSNQNVPLDHIPVYVRPGAIVTLGPVIQYTGQMPGGPLDVHVYAGADGSFRLVEDDGDTYDYQSGMVRSTVFSWNDATRTLSWTVDDALTESSSCYTNAVVTAFSSDGVKQASGTLGKNGQVTL